VEYSADRRQWRKAQTIVDGQVVCNNRIHKIRLDGLEPGVRYFYRIASREITLYRTYLKEFGRTAYSPEYSFRLPPSGESDFTAIVFNDLHKNKALVDTLTHVIRDVEYDFVLLNGDVFADPADEADAVDFLSHLSKKVDGAGHPIILLRGNHEIRNAYSMELRDILDYIGDKTYGAFDWGDTRFVMLDCGEDKPDSHEVYYGLNDFERLRLDQVGFLEGELSGDAFLDAGKRVLVHHIPVYGLDDDFNPCRELWHPMLGGAPFDICINGHTHRPMYHPKGSVGNNFPVVVGGGSSVSAGTAMVLSRNGDDLRLKMLSSSGETLYDLNLTPGQRR
jgi:predicted phosphodiesterase